MSDKLVSFVREVYQTNDFIPLHAPVFKGNEKQYVNDTLESTFVSSVGAYVDRFEEQIATFTGSEKAIAVVNGTAALHTALYAAGVKQGDIVVTQALTFVATCNAIFHMGANPLFVDVSPVSMGLCPRSLNEYLDANAKLNDIGECILKETGQVIRAVVPMHTFGHPVEMDELLHLCRTWNICLVEDAAESLGSYYKGQHTGTIGNYGAMSFNGNKIITTGGGGIVITNDPDAAKRIKHITTTAKVPHSFEFFHDEPGFNYRMPNLNAALGCGQLEQVPRILKEKRALAEAYAGFFEDSALEFVKEPDYASSNYWLNAVLCEDKKQRNILLKETNDKGIMTRPVWTLMHKLPMFKGALRGSLETSEYLEERLVNIPSSPVTLSE